MSSAARLRAIPAPAPAPVVRIPRKSRVLGVVEQVKVALRRSNRLAAFCGFMLGGFVPVASWWLAHNEIRHGERVELQLASYLVLGALVYSANSVFSWGRLAFNSGPKALGFCVLLEGVLVASSTPWLSIVALVYLAAINGVATACNLVARRSA